MNEKNIISEKEYILQKKDLEQYFVENNLIKSKTKQYEYKEYILEVEEYKTREKCWNYTKGIIKKNGIKICEIKRNYSSFFHLFYSHSNGNDYLICGEDYQGYTIFNLTKEEKYSYVPNSWFTGTGFCFVYVEKEESIDGKITDLLRVEGCHWGAPFEIMELDFSNPEKLPLPIVDRWYEEDCE